MQAPKNSPFEILHAKNGSLIAKADGKLLHSSYNPEREAEQSVTAARKDENKSCVFLACGLGYAPNLYAKKFPRDTLIIVEPELRYLLAALEVFDWSPVFSAARCMIITGAEVQTVITLIENSGGFSSCGIIANPSQMEHKREYFSSLSRAIEHAKEQTKINGNTYKRFYGLWLRNTCRNLHQLAIRGGINSFKGACPPDLPAVILAAGPSLSALLPHLAEIKKRALLICVDTALHACLRSGTEPDFIVLTDPQYYAARHIAGLSAPHAFLITETAAYPPVFHFPCREILLCSSLFPLSVSMEKELGEKGSLASGGSVSTTAWEFSRYIGAREIYLAGLDLGYPDFQTHIRGSSFEEKIHTISLRTRPAESTGLGALFGANMMTARDYRGQPILTDNRMFMFASWFESKLKEYPDLHTYSLSQKSLAIEGVQTAPVEKILSLPEKEKERKDFFARQIPFTPCQADYKKALQILLKDPKVCEEMQKNNAKFSQGF